MQPPSRRFLRAAPICAALVLILDGHSATAQALTGSLKKIKESGEITIGYRESSIPHPSAIRSTCAAGSSMP